MTIYGLSQSGGNERLLEVERADGGVLLYVQDTNNGQDRDKIVVPSAALIDALVEPAKTMTSIEGVSAADQSKKNLDIDVRGNEVLLWVRPEAGSGWDVAVGFDDFQDAIAQVGDEN